MFTCDEIIDAGTKSYDEETKTTFTTNFKEKKQPIKEKNSIFY